MPGHKEPEHGADLRSEPRAGGNRSEAEGGSVSGEDRIERAADELDERRRKIRSRAYRDRDKQLEAKPSAARIEAVRRSREKAAKHRRENLFGWVEEERPPLSVLAVAVRDYLDKHPADARQPAGWIGVTLWTYG